jgi:hypothetical protein
MVLVYGTDHESLKRGPGLDPRTFFPGQHRSSTSPDIARRTPRPFSKIDSLAQGDVIRVEMPYGTVHVQGHRQPRRRGDRPLGAEVEALRADHPAGLPPALLRVAPLDHVRPPHEGRPAGHRRELRSRN